MKALIAAILLLSPTAFAILPESPDATMRAPPPVPLALNATTVDVVSVPSFFVVGENVTVSWDVSLEANESASNISETAVYFDTVSHSPGPLDRSLYASAAAGVLTGGTVYSAAFGNLSPVGPLFLLFYANVSGTDYYNGSEWSVDVRSAPSLALNGAASDSAILHGSSANLTVDAQWPYGDSMDAIQLVWDTVPHGSNGTNASDYANAELAQSGTSGNYTFMITPVGAGNIYFTFAAEVLGSSYMAPAEYTLQVAGEPLITRDSSPPWILSGASATVQWSVLVEDFINYTTELRFDSASHPAPRSALDYPSVAGSFSGSGAGSYQATIVAPSGTAVFFYLVAYVDGRAFAVTDLGGERLEFTVEIRPHPVLQLAHAPTYGFVGRNVTVEMRVAWGYADTLPEVAVHYDTTSHGGVPTLPLAYAAVSQLTAIQAGWFNFTMDARGAPATLYYAFRVRVGATDILSAQELSLPVYAQPTVSVVGPAWALPSAVFQANVTVTWSQSMSLAVRLHSDPTSGAPGYDPLHYDTTDSDTIAPSGTVTFLVTAPATPGPLYLFASVVSEGETFGASGEAVVSIPGAPVIDRPVLRPASGKALFGQNVSVTWRVNFTENVTVSADFRWDTRSHVNAGGFDFNDYPNASALITSHTGAPMTTFFTAPNASTVIFGVVRAVFQGRNYYTAEEVVIQVLPLPVVEITSFADSVETDQSIAISWRIAFQGEPSLIPHTAVHWGLVSKVGLPQSYNNYPGVAGPYAGTATNIFNASIPAQDSPGTVYFIVHAVVNDMHFYLAEEQVEVHVPSGTGGGGFLPAWDVAAVLAATACVAVALRASRSGRRH